MEGVVEEGMVGGMEGVVEAMVAEGVVTFRTLKDSHLLGSLLVREER